MKLKVTYNYPLRLDKKDRAAVAQVVSETGESINSVLTLSIRKGLPLARSALQRPAKRVTAVDPLPDELVRAAYLKPDELDQISSKQLWKFQSQNSPE